MTAATIETVDEHEKWIRGRVLVLLSHFHNDFPEQILKEQANDWVSALRPYPRDEVQAACRAYLAENQYRPAPGDITGRILAARADALKSSRAAQIEADKTTAEMVRRAVEDGKSYLLTTISPARIRNLAAGGHISADIARKAGAL